MYLEVSTDNSTLLFRGVVYYFEFECSGEKPIIKLYSDRTTIMETIKLKKDYVVDIMTWEDGKLIGQIIV